MEPAAFAAPGVMVALALAVGIVAQAAGRHAGIPGIVLLLAAGVLLGPDVAGAIRPEALGHGLSVLVGFAVAVILFEGGMNLDVRRLRREQRSIRQLVTLGAVVTAVGAALTARWVMGWPWSAAALFGTLVIVTGPTVITPLLRRIKVQRSVATVLEAEGVLIDAIGAVAAVVALEVALSPTGEGFAHGALALLSRLGFGTLAGLAGGAVLALLLRRRNLVPEGLENVFTLSLVLALFQLSNAALPESGIAAVTVAGLVVGNVRTHVQRELMEFKEQLTVLLIGMLFVLLAADVRLADVMALGWPGVATVALLIAVVRPLNVLVGTWGSGLTWRQRTFMAWMGPRGIVAAAVASLFAATLERQGLPGGTALRALVFLVIAATVTVAGISGGLVAWLLGVRRRSGVGWAILGADDLALTVAGLLRDAGEEVLCIDHNPHACTRAEGEGLRVICANGLEERTLLRAEIDIRAAAVALTPNAEANLLFVRMSRRLGPPDALLAAVEPGESRITSRMVHDAGAHVLFGGPRDVGLWSRRLRNRQAEVGWWHLAQEPQLQPTEEAGGAEAEETAELPAAAVPPPAEAAWLPLLVRRGGEVLLVDETTRFAVDDEVAFAVDQGRLEQARDALHQAGWRPGAPAVPPA